MCGIVGYVGSRQAAEVLLEGLKRLEYRGYDSAGIVTVPGGQKRSGESLDVVKRAGKLDVLQDALRSHPLTGGVGLGHTRWATHGKPDDLNAHPHLSEDGKLAIIHNGIIENFLSLRARLEARGHRFSSETDSEVLVHLIEEWYRGDLVSAVQAALAEVAGAYALVVAHVDHHEIVAARETSPLVIGLGADENLVASDVTALLPHTRQVIYLHDGDVAVITESQIELRDALGRPLKRPVTTVDWDAEAAEKGGHPHFMLKEILEQPGVLLNTFGGRFTHDDAGVRLELTLEPRQVERVVVVAAGTAYYAGLVGEYLIEKLARIPVEVEVASEFRYRDPVLGAGTLCIAVSQSGETIDTLEALREAKRRGAMTLGILNVRSSSLSREVDDVLLTRAGPEIGVASTKAYLAMVAAFELLAIWFGRAHGTLSITCARDLIKGLKQLPSLIEQTLLLRGSIAEVAQKYKESRDFLFLGRGINFPTALEGALKLKEISYIHAEAYATGEMKHGPIALIDEQMPVLVVVTDSELYHKTVSNIQEVKARGGIVIALASAGDTMIDRYADHIIRVPHTEEPLSPLVNVVALQLLAYETACLLGLDVDRPRNLAKSVTVE
ncbi:MAG: glutamine--fructose-6-phosphate transaminase (isomerizing) [Trueperaceae bacterium]|nr:MAG: glutamine--fructose-6-phosphate transaminase (isomerizing) [Trueperaceae bacterium]